MAKTYRKIQQWDRWLEHFPGNKVLEAEQKYLPHLVSQFYGKHALLIGTPRQCDLLKASSIVDQVLLSPLLNHEPNKRIRGIESELYELPISSGSIDLVLLPHTLEFLDHPRHLLSEACRVVKPEGHIIVSGFNPYSLWGLKKLLVQNKNIPWSGNFTPASSIKNWLKFADFELIKHENLLYRPPVKQIKLYQNLHFMEWLGNKLHLPFGGLYILVAQAKVIPLTPIKMRWKQSIYGLGLPAISVPKPTTRNTTE